MGHRNFPSFVRQVSSIQTRNLLGIISYELSDVINDVIRWKGTALNSWNAKKVPPST